MIRTRFAPSPTGFLHIGGLRTALYAYLLAKSKKGSFILRVEDTDQERFVEGSIENILHAMQWGGITPDEGPVLEKGSIVTKGEFGPYIQSERLSLYKKHIAVLLEKGSAYKCYCTKERLDELREIQQKNKQAPGYDGHCRNLQEEKDAPFVIRLKMPKEGTTEFDDLVRGKVEFENKLIDDQVLIKSDGFPTYHFAVVVDDYEMNITHVIRGEEWISSTPKHIALYNMFGWDPPVFAHLPVLVNEQKKKLSKRHGDVSVQDFREKGYLPEAIINFISFLGWNPGDDREIFSLAELVSEFDFEKVGKSPSFFDREKLDWYNQQYLRALDISALTALVAPYMINAGLISEASLENDQFVSELEAIVALEQERAVTLHDFPEHLAFIFAEEVEYPSELLVWRKGTKEEAKELLSELQSYLSTYKANWSKDDLESNIIAWMKEHQFGTGNVLWPARVALSGKKNSPGPFEIMSVLGKEKTIQRIQDGIDRL